MTTKSDSDQDVVGITVGKYTLSGWQDVRITRSVERLPSSFTLELTELYPGTPDKIVIRPGDPCQVTIGGETVITGYVDQYAASISDQSHQVTIHGRGMCEDLVDCSAKFPAYQTNSCTLVRLAEVLCKPFGISVVANDGDSEVIPTFNVTLTESPYEILESIARWSNFLLYDDTDGNLVIATLGDTKHASGFSQGQNIQAASVNFSADERFTEYDPVYVSTDFLIDPPGDPGDPPPALPYIPDTAAFDKSFPDRDDDKPRYRPLIVVSEQMQNSQELAANRAQWEMSRRLGRSQSVHITCDSWRDSEGTLWQPNALALVDAPILKLDKQVWLISEVVFVRSLQGGTTAEVTLMPKEAFVPQKQILTPYDWQVGLDQPKGADAGPQPNAQGLYRV